MHGHLGLRRVSRECDERGAVAIFVSLMLAPLLVMAALVVDIGMQRVARSDMQTVADIVALDLSRALDGSTVQDYRTATPSLQTLADRSRDANDTTLGSKPVVTYQLGEITSTGGFRELTADKAVPTAVRVTASASVDFAFRPGTGGVSRSAVAAATSFACYKVGSWAAMLDTGNSVLLDPILRQMAQQSGAFTNGGTVSALSYTGLAASKVDLNALSAQLGVASVNDLATSTVKARDLFLALKALATPSNTTTVNLLNSLALATSTTATVAMGKLLNAQAGSGSLVGATANALDLVGGSISLLNGVNVANVYLGATLPSLTSAGIAVKLIQGPHQYCGSPGTAATAGVATDTEQLNVHLGGNLNPVTLDFVPPAITGLLSGLTTAQITAQNYVTFDLSVAGTTSALRSVSCGGVQTASFDVANGLATLTVSTPLRAKVEATLLGQRASIAIDATVKVVATISPSGTHTLTISVPPQAFDAPYGTQAGGISLAPATIQGGANVTANVLLLGGLLGANISLSTGQKNQILDSVINAGLAQLFSPTDVHSLSTTILRPMLALVGADVAGSDVILDSVPALSCASPKLAG